MRLFEYHNPGVTSYDGLLYLVDRIEDKVSIVFRFRKVHIVIPKERWRQRQLVLVWVHRRVVFQPIELKDVLLAAFVGIHDPYHAVQNLFIFATNVWGE